MPCFPPPPPVKPLRASKVAVLTLRRNHLPPAAGSCIRDLLVGNNTLRRLDLRHNALRVRGPSKLPRHA